jgi:threonylcarbamoyladenosine tRNA methylthiotransferase MtaB
VSAPDAIDHRSTRVKYTVVTFGCRVNQADSLAVEAELSSRGAERVSADRAELIIVNTCSVTASADQGARQSIRRMARENPGARIVATGCYATRCAAEVSALPGVAAVVPNDRKDAGVFLAALVDGDGRPRNLADGPCGRPTPGLMGRTAWTLRVQTGCDEHCSYCIIPTTRGPGRSRSLGEVQAEIARVASAGYKEIVLTGVHLGSYGRDLRPRRSLAELLHSLAGLDLDSIAPGVHRVLVRVSSLEPMDCSREIVDIMVGRPADAVAAGVVFAPHFHLPLQHASNAVLARMRRPYDLETYAALVDGIRLRLPHAAIGADVLVGFPGETDDDFAALETYLRQSPLTHLHVFPYSPRPGTDAAARTDTVHGTTIRRRAERVRAVSTLLQKQFRDGLRGTRRPALTLDDGRVAMTDNFVRVEIGPGHGRNEWVTVTL